MVHRSLGLWLAGACTLLAVVGCAGTGDQPDLAGAPSDPVIASSSGPRESGDPTVRPTPAAESHTRGGASSAAPTTIGADAPMCPEGVGASGVRNPPSGVSTDRLVPDETPTSALLCAYLGTNMGGPKPLTGQAVLRGDLASITDDLIWLAPKLPGQSKVCTQMGGPQTDYLLALTYPDGGLVWVSGAQDPNNCTETTNGSFRSIDNTGAWFTAAMNAGRWVPQTKEPDYAACSAGGSRFGQETDMVPPGVTSVDICRTETGSAPRVDTTLTSGFDDVVAALNAGPTTPSTRMCQMTGQPAEDGGKPQMGPGYTIVARYLTGPPVAITVMSDCDPAMDNSSLQAADGSAVIAALESILDRSGRTTASTR